MRAGRRTDAGAGIPSSAPGTGGPLSFAQERFWWLDRTAPDSATYHLAGGLTLLGALEHDALERALTEIVRRHEPLRTAIELAAEAPRQRVVPPAVVDLPLIDLGGLEPRARDARVRELEKAEACRPLDLPAGLVLRARLLRLARGHHRLLLVLHHVAADGWSLRVLRRELATAYRAFVAGRRPRLPPLRVRYVDYARWQRGRLAGDRLERQLAFWRQRLEGLEPLELPVDRPRPPAARMRGGWLPFVCDADRVRALRALAKAEGATLFTVVETAFAVLVGRWSGAHDVALGVPVAGRDRPELESLVGCFVNTLVLRHDLAPRKNFRAFVGQARELALAAQAHREAPFEEVTEALRRQGTTPLIRAMLAFDADLPGAEVPPGLELVPYEVSTDTAKLDLTLFLKDTGDVLEGGLEIDRDLFDVTTAQRLLARFELLLAAAVATPDVPLARLPLLDAAERQQVLREWAVAAKIEEGVEVEDVCLHRLLDRRARRGPDAVAVRMTTAAGEEAQSYRSLARQARHLAHRLRALGVKPGSTVALDAARTPEMVAGVWGILAAGAAYLPLDPGLPPERRRFLLADSGAAALVAQGGAEPAPLPAVRLERGPALGRGPTPILDGPGARPESLAYVIYTSGSTGRPKGVGVSHRGAAGYLRWCRVAYPEAAGGSLLHSPMGFDLSVTGLYAALLAGATVRLVPEEAGAEGFVEALARGPGTGLLKLTPAHLELLDRRLPPERLARAARLLVVGGEALHAEALGRWREHAPDTRVVNEYGPTEAVVGCATYAVELARWRHGPLPIGRPIAGAELHLLDGALEPVTIGTAGELYAGGAALARGYLGRPALTAESFVPHPFATRPGARLYRTGDRALHAGDGNLRFLGRRDDQIKLRGLRVEPGEIEAVLRELDGVDEAAVTLRRVEGDPRLVAHLAPAPGSELDADALRLDLERRLPAAMVPAAYDVLERLPLTANGKIDRACLARRPLPATAGEKPREAPRTLTEELLAGFFAELLGRPVGVKESFFALGGHSLAAVRLLARVQNVCGVTLPLRSFFAAPTVAALARRIERARAAGRSPAPPLVRARRREGDLAPASFAQERLWLLDRLEPGSPAYNVPLAVDLAGDLDGDALAAALGALARRHEVLRTRFVEKSGGPRQLIDPPAPVPLPRIDLAGLDAGPRRAEARRLAAAEAARPFDLARGPLWRARFLRLGARRHWLVLNLHHAVSDGWSLGVFLRELAALYAAAVRERRAAGLAPLPVQYADFARWQRRWLRGEALEERLAFWRRELADTPVLELPTDRPRRARVRRRAAHLELALSADFTAALEDFVRRRGATTFMALAAAFAALLGRGTGQREVALGTPVAGRERLEVEGLIGFFVNTLVLRAGLADDDGSDASFAALVARLREKLLAAAARAEVPFEKIVAEIDPERRLDTTPLFQAMLAFQNAPLGPLELPGLELEPLPLASGAAKLDLLLSLEPRDGRLTGTLEYDRDLFDRTTVRRLLGSFGRLLRAAVAEPEKPLSELSICSPGERHQLLREWNDPPGRAAANDLTLDQLLAARACRSADAVAAVDERRALSYGALDRRAAGLAARLRGAGAQPDHAVAVAVERSVELPLALMAVLRAGSAYVPIDPDHPPRRVAFLLEDADAAVLLTRRRLLERLPAELPPTVLLEEGLDAGDEAPAATPARPAGLAYTIYTSGSTGQPKGAMNSHRAIVNRLDWMQDAFALEAGDRVLQKTPAGFDVSVWEFFWPLLEGARLVLVRPGGHRDPAYLARAIARHGVTVAHFVPSMLAAFVDEPRAAACRSLRQVIASGEALAPELARRFHRRLPGARLHNLYGPTEAAVDVSVWPSTPEAESMPIGRPIAGVQLHLADRRLRPLPLGAHGELLIGGVQLARGYLRRPRLTAERFVPDPFAAEPGARLYRTGDLARHRADGAIEYLGRIDHQVKLRGVRIELGEVEAALRALPGVREAAVSVHRDRGLVAHLVVDGPPPAADELRRRLARALPEAMLPSAFDFLDRLPLNVNGKLDRAALGRRPLPGVAGELATAATGPRSPTEELLAGLFAELAGRRAVAVEDRFFDLGGHSLSAARLLARVREAFGVELSLRDFFAAPTVAGLARAVADAQTRERRPAPPLRAGRRRPGELEPASFAQERLWLLDRLEPGSPAYNVPVALDLRGSLDTAALEAALHAMARRQESLRTTFVEVDGEPRQRIAAAARAALPRIDLAGLAAGRRDGEARRLARAEAATPFDLARGPLWRALLLRLEADEHRLLLAFHHVVADGWSLGVTMRELAALYPAALARRPATLAPPPVQVADFARWQRRWLRDEALAERLVYWRRRLEGVPVLELPTDRPRRVRARRPARRLEARLEARLATAVERFSRAHGVTPFMTFAAALAVLLGRLASQRELALGTPMAGRGRVELEGLIGFFVNTLPLRIDLAAGDREGGFGGLVEQVRELVLEADAHAEIPFEKIVAELEPERRLDTTPIFQAVLAFQELPRAPLALPGLELEPRALANGAAKFDLLLSLEPRSTDVALTLETDRDLFDATTARRLLVSFERLLAAAVEMPATSPWELPLLVAAARHQLLGEERETPADAVERPLHAGVRAWRRRTPEAVALVAGESGEQTVSYRELCARAGHLAERLRARGASPETPVAVALERGAGLVTALLAVLETGAPYLPLDLEQPIERLAFLVADAGARLMLASRQDLSRLDALPVRLVATDDAARSGEASMEHHARRPPARVSPSSLAYVIYTSGSTGRPKGVGVSHRNALRLFSTTEPAFAFGPGDVWTFFHSHAFDFSVWEIWGALTRGGRLVVVPQQIRRDPRAFARLLRRARVSVLNQTPSAFRPLLEALGQEPPPALRLAVFGGEALEPRDLAPWLDRDERPRLVNMYGITETTVHVTRRELREADAAHPGRSPIGRPLPDLSLYLLDRRGHPVPWGTVGEMQVGGAGVARGYLGRPALTAERFVPDPWGGEPGARLYRSGDLARRAATGELEFLGRGDHQVKIRGFRIETGEIAAALAALPQVDEAAVLVRDEGDRRLVAHVVVAAGVEPRADELRRALARRLPEHMLPAAFDFLAELPLTANGKLDRAALERRPLAEEPESGGDKAPRGAAEELLCGIWSEVLGRERVGRDADFFELGGHSLLATRVVARVREVFGVELPLRRLFAAPTPAGLAAALAAASGSEAPPLAAGPRPPRLPLTFAQERLWFLERFETGAAYNLPVALALDGDLDLAALRHALGEIVGRHEALRTVFRLDSSGPVQVIGPPAPPALALVDLSALARERRPIETRRALAGAARRPFDLGSGPLLRALVARLDGNRHAFGLTLHHVIADGWSMAVLIRELGAIYDAFRAGRRAALAELPIQYADYALWQRRWLAGETLRRELDGWRARLAGLEPLDLPADRPRPPLRRLRGETLARRLSPHLLEGLKRLSHGCGATLFMTLLAAFDALLVRLAGGTDVAVGTPIANRDRLEVEELIGLFVNTLVLRVDLGGDPGFATAVARVREACLEAWAHGELPFEKLVAELGARRDLSRTPLFGVLFALQNAVAERPRLAGLETAPLALDTGTAKFDLSLVTAEGPEGLECFAEYDRDLFDRTTILRLMRHYETLLVAVAAAPTTPLSALPIASAAERAQLLREWSDTAPARETLVSETVPALVAAAAAARPEALAVVLGERHLSYGELDRRARRLGPRLRRHGIGRERLVAVVSERSPEMVTALWAVLRRGGAYLPLDPATPRRRLELMIADAGVAAVLASASQRPRLAERVAGSAPVLALEADEADETDRDFPPIDPAQLAYVIYTSGSTGRPKGVAISHRGLVSLLRWHWRRYRTGPDDRSTQIAGLAFDASVWEIWPHLAAGASLDLPPEEIRAEPAGLPDWLAARRVTVSFLPTPVAEVVLERPWPARLALRALLTGGDRLRQPPRTGLGFRLVNHYGPTESTVVATCGEVAPTAATTAAAPPAIGRPIEGVRALVCDRRLRWVPLGGVGELVLGGDALARGYLDRPGLTAARFVPEPDAERGGRLYRTGDLVRWRADGRLDFLGRLDQQVKVRGLRIELGEIEALLASRAELAEAAVAVQGEGGGRRLVAYLVPSASAEIVTEELATWLGERLPEYMVPAVFVELERLPLTANGKLDRAALPEPADTGPTAPYVAPESALERTVAGVFRQALEVSRLGLDDNFFDLGGNSLSLAQAADRLRHELDRPVPIVEVFRSPTVRGLAQRLAEQDGGDERALGEVDRHARQRREAMGRRRRRRLRRAS